MEREPSAEKRGPAGVTQNEKRLLAVLAGHQDRTAESVAEEMQTATDAVIQWAHLAEENGFATMTRTVNHTYVLTEEGEIYAGSGLPERQLLNSFEGSIDMATLKQHPLSKIAIGWMRKKGWVTIRDGVISRAGDAPEGIDEKTLKGPLNEGEGLNDLIRRGLVVDQETAVTTMRLTPAGEALVSEGLDLREETGQITHEHLLTGEWEHLNLRRYRINRLPRRATPGKIHPYQRLIDEMRQILLEMGFTEISGELVQSAFWNFDALFQPQDHPAREMQDTFYLAEQTTLPEGYERVKAMHEHGGDTTSCGWGGVWSGRKAEQCVLRTHTTGLSIQYLATHQEPPVRAFCISRVYRREAIDPTHTPEFEQLEGIVMDKEVTFSHLLGFLKEFYLKMGFADVRFRPAYFPYTEPSVEPEVYVDGLGWVEIGGAGIFRQEVTDPWGVKTPVLAWGLGVSRVAMLKLGLKDLRMLYRSDIDWIRDAPVLSADALQSTRR